MLIGLAGYAGAGKDEVAKILVREHGLKRIAFADPLRSMLYDLNPVIDCDCYGSRPVRVKDLVDTLGWDVAKRNHQEIRELLQRLGNEAAKPVFGDSCWTDIGMAAARESHLSVVFSDCRFPVEAQAVRDAGGQIWEVRRPGVGPVNGHASDAGLPPDLVDRPLWNDGTLADLGNTVWLAVQSV